ncbi:D-sedoheptulose-7-phosphate isomerase [Corynebacterium halotolerans]|uniref:D-sedoheptulose-7-phosphate isomerase n=1 Tax=Corynebacterium halotolerans TaxID=225326 RepID=UPI003CC73455
MTTLSDDGIGAHLDGVETAVASLRAQSCTLARWGRELATKLSAGNRLLTAGNGGSAAEAQHLSSELVGRFQGDRPAFSAIALTTDASAVTAISNDYGYEEVFSRQIEGHARAGDVLLLLTTSGTSRNLLRAAETARKMGVRVWALTGPEPNPLTVLCDDVVAIDADSPNVQEAHLMAIHGVCRAFDAEVARLTTRRTATTAVPAATAVGARGSRSRTRDRYQEA